VSKEVKTATGCSYQVWIVSDGVLPVSHPSFCTCVCVCVCVCVCRACESTKYPASSPSCMYLYASNLRCLCAVYLCYKRSYHCPCICMLRIDAISMEACVGAAATAYLRATYYLAHVLSALYSYQRLLLLVTA
jgi:hypothetical protein